MKIKLYSFLFLFLFLDCYDAGISNSERNSAKIFFMYYFTYRSLPDDYVIEDNKDGTLETIKYRQSTSIFGNGIRERLSTGLIIKKCIQGQVYRLAQNDCKGKGTQADWWGAEKFQWCQTNDRACERSSLTDSSSVTYSPDPGKALPSITCKSDITAGKKWISPDEVRSSYKDHIQRKDEIPSGENNFYWTSYTNSTITSLARVGSFTDNSFYDTKTNYHYILCGGLPK